NFDSTSSRSSQFRQWKSKQLLGYAFKRFDSTSLISCGQQCLRNQRCSSTNFKWSSSKKDGEGTCELNDHKFSFIEENVNFVHQEYVTFSMKVIQLLVCVKVKENVDHQKYTKPLYVFVFSKVMTDCPLDWIVFGRSCYLLFYNTTPNCSDAQSICQTHGAHLPILHIYRRFVQLSKIKYTLDCPQGWFRHENSCYLIHNTPTPRWNDALTFCQNHQAHPPIIKSADENDFIFRLVMSQPNGRDRSAWIGLSRKMDDKFYWMDDTPLAGRFSAWAQGEPNYLHEKCVFILVKKDRQKNWLDSTCTYNGTLWISAPVVLCQKRIYDFALIINLFSLSSQISTCDFGVFVLIVIDFHLLPVRKDCPLDWIVFGRSCYLLFYTPTPNWSDVQSNCQTHGVHLPILHLSLSN
ncbi:unnamed protein product, partial [Pocillopora meandrina]